MILQSLIVFPCVTAFAYSMSLPVLAFHCTCLWESNFFLVNNSALSLVPPGSVAEMREVTPESMRDADWSTHNCTIAYDTLGTFAEQIRTWRHFKSPYQRSHYVHVRVHVLVYALRITCLRQVLGNSCSRATTLAQQQCQIPRHCCQWAIIKGKSDCTSTPAFHVT